MKKKYKSLRLLAACLGLGIAGMQAAPLSGVYTINSSLSTSGTNYQTFTAFANDINANGVSGPVTVNVTTTGQTYNEQISFNQITGASLSNKIVINGNGNTISYNANSSQPWTISMNGADYFTFNGLIIAGVNTNYAYACILYNNADNNTFTSCTFSVPANVTSSYCIPFTVSGAGNYYYSTGTGYANNNTVSTSTLFSGYSGVSVFGGYNYPAAAVGNKFIGNKIVDFYVYGVWGQYGIADHSFINNIIECPTRTVYTTKYGIYLYGTQGTLIEGNWIRNLWATSLGVTSSSAFGIYLFYNWMSTYYGMKYPSDFPNVIRNNVISDFHSTGQHFGIYAFYYDGEIYNNTISLDDQNTASSSTYGIYSYGYQGNGIYHVTQNIVTCTRPGNVGMYAYQNASGSTGSDLTCDRNDFYVTPGSSNYWVTTPPAPTRWHSFKARV